METVIILMIMAAISNAVMDRSALNQLWGKWWNKGDSWEFKWKLSNIASMKGELKPNNKRLWYYLWLYKPDYIEKFPYSSTMFVWVTDAWHLFQFIMLSCFQLAISLNINFIYFDVNQFYNEVLEFLALKIIFSLVFLLFYNKILKDV